MRPSERRDAHALPRPHAPIRRRALARLRALAAAFLLAGFPVAIPAAAPGPVVAIGPLPECRLDDILTVPRGYDDYEITLVDWILSLGRDYKPTDLVPVSRAGLAGGGSVRRVAIDDLRELVSAAKAEGLALSNVSTYRSYRQQRQLFDGYVRAYGFDEAITFSARPGHSEHQLGLTIDFVSPGAGLSSSWEETRTGGWMARNAWRYGWLMSYPKGKTDVTCYMYEPWHYRYVGREMARTIRDSGLTIREYLWANYTLVDPTTGEPLPTATPVPPETPAPPTAAPASEPPASDAPPSQTASEAPTSTPVPSGPPTSDVGGILGLDPAVLAVLLLAVAAVGLVASVGMARRSRRR